MDKAIFIMDMLFPPHCLFCGELKPFREECKECEELERKYRITGEEKLNFRMSARTVDRLSKVISSYIYSDDTADMVARYKFRRQYSMGREMAKKMGADIIEILGEDCCDIVMPVPAFNKNENQHSALIAKRIAKILSRPCLAETLVKTSQTQPQHKLSLTERAGNLEGVFSVSDAVEVKDKRILLCDDVITSGNTLNECAKALLDAGASEVLAATFSATDQPIPAAGKKTVKRKKQPETVKATERKEKDTPKKKAGKPKTGE